VSTDTLYRLTFTGAQRDELINALGEAEGTALDGFALARRVCAEEDCTDDYPCIDCQPWATDIAAAERGQELIRSAWPLCDCGALSTEPDENATPVCDACLKAEQTAPTTSCGHPFVARRDLPGEPCFPCAQSRGIGR
jgi:hypothetical protein